MVGHPLSRLWAHRFFAAILIFSLLLPGYTPVQAADDVMGLVKEFEKTLGKTPGGSRDAALKVLEKYQEYKHLVNAEGSNISRSTAKAIDDQLIGMTQETWRDVSLKKGSRLSHIVPVGTLGTRNTGGAYIPGKSDKDFIPQGTGASEAVDDFNTIFSKKFKIKPEIVDVNVLDPTKIETWPDRVRAAANAEKYNTKGGINWLENQLYKDKPNLWRYDTAGDAIGEVSFTDMVKKPPPAMGAADTLGFASDNLRFRDEILRSSKLSPGEMALKSSKYDLRTLEAFQLSGGKLTADEQALVEMTKLFRNPPGGTLDSAVNELVKRTGKSSNDALRYYLEGMENLNKGMTRQIAENYLDLMKPGKNTAALTSELAAALSNLPSGLRSEVEDLAVKKLGKAEFNEVSKLAEAFKTQLAKVRFGTVYFNEQALQRYGKAYDQLSAEQKAALHGAEEAAESFAGKVFKTLGYTAAALFAGYSIYIAYEEGSKQGTGTGILTAGGRAFIELLELGYPPALAAELVARLAAGATNLGTSAYKNDVLNSLFDKYKNGDYRDIDELLNTLGVQHYDAGGLRQMAIEMRAENPKLTDAQIDEAIKNYFVNRLKNEKEQEENIKKIGQLEAWISDNHIQLSEKYMDNFDLMTDDEKEYYGILANWMAKYAFIKDQLDKDGIPATPENIHLIVSRLLYGSHEEYIRAMNSQYAVVGKNFKAVAGLAAPKSTIPEAPCKGIACLKFGAYATVQPKTIPPNPGVIWSGGGSFAEHGVDQPCDPGQEFGPFEIAGGANMKASITGSPSVPRTWSLYNSNTSMVVMFSPKIGTTHGRWDGLASLGGQAEDSDIKQEFTFPGAGQMKIIIGPPKGSGPLSGACFSQGYNAKVEVLEMNASSDAHHGTAFDAGDKITTAGSPVVMQMADGTKLEVKANSIVSFDQDASGQPVVRLEKGRIHFTSPPQGGKPIMVKVGDKTITRKGTDFIVFNDGWGKGVSVIGGSVTVTGDDGTQTEVGKGREMDLISGALKDYKNPDDTNTRMHNLRLQDLFIGDTTPEPEGKVAGPTTASPTDGGWVWQDPGYESSLDVTGGQVKMTVPHGKCIGSYCDNSPVLMHKVSGDFDLQTRALLTGPNDRWVTLDFILYAPDSYMGVTANQVKEDSLFAHTRLVGAAWNRGWGRSMLKVFNKDFYKGGQEVPDSPVLLRLTRRGDIFRTYWSTDSGSNWNLSAREQFAAPETLYTGWTAIYGGDSPGNPKTTATTLDDISMTSAPLNSLPQPAWDIVSREGSVSVSDKTASLELDGSKSGEAWAYRGEILPGDFEVTASYKAAPWTQQAGESRGFNLLVESVDGVKMVYAGAFQNDGYGYQFHTNYHVSGGPRGTWNRMEASGTSGKLRLVRKDGVITAFIYSGGQWVEIDKGYAEKITEPVIPAVQIYNTFDATIPAAVQVDFTIEKITGQAAGTTTTAETTGGVTPAVPVTQAEPAVTGEQAGAKDLQSFSDDFSSNINPWKIVSDVNNGTSIIKNGKLNLQVTKPDKYLSVQVPWYITKPVSDVTLSVTATVQTPGLGAFGLFCRASDSHNFYMVSILPKPAGGGKYRFYKDKAGKITNLTDWKETSLLYGGEVPEEVVFSCKGTKLRLELNGQLAEEVTDSDLKSGNVHLFALSLEDVTASNPYKITFDDFTATMP